MERQPNPAAGAPALIFDFGNVVAHFDYARAGARFGAKLGLSGAEMIERARDAGFVPLLQRYEAGQIGTQEFSSAFAALSGLDLTHDDFAAAWSDIFWLNEPVARLVEWLADRGYRLVLGSNTNDLHAAQFRRQFAETLGRFDRLVLSYEVGHIKPTAGFYAACVAAAGRPAGECVFIDDLAENVEGARAAGLLGIRYDPSYHAALLGRLAELGVEVPPR